MQKTIFKNRKMASRLKKKSSRIIKKRKCSRIEKWRQEQRKKLSRIVKKNSCENIINNKNRRKYKKI